MWEGKLDGIWWIPSDPDNRVAGSLETTEDGRLQLSIIGTFTPLEALGVDHRPGLIVGATGQGKLVTLLRPVAVNWKLTAPGMPSSAYSVPVAVFGHLFEREEEVIFDRVDIQYPLLLEWAQVSGFKLEHQLNESKHLEMLGVDYTFPEPISAALPDVEVSLAYEASQSGDYRNHASITQTTRLRLAFPEPLEIDRIWGHFKYQLQNYFAFATGVAVQPESIMAQSPNARRDRKGEDEQSPISLELWIRSSPNDVKDREKLTDYMLFARGDLAASWQESLGTWFERADLLGPVFDLYFALRYKPDTYLSSQFLSLVQALEVLDRRTASEARYFPPERFAELRASLTEQLPQDLDEEVAQVFRSRLGFMNEHGLKHRLKRLWSAATPAIEFLIPDGDRFAKVAGDTRNFLTHYSPKLEPKAAEGESLYWLVQQARSLLELRLLAEIGFSAEAIAALVRRNQRFVQLASSVTNTVSTAPG